MLDMSVLLVFLPKLTMTFKTSQQVKNSFIKNLSRKKKKNDFVNCTVCHQKGLDTHVKDNSQGLDNSLRISFKCMFTFKEQVQIRPSNLSGKSHFPDSGSNFPLKLKDMFKEQ